MYFVLTATIIQIEPRARFPSNGWITTTFLYQAIDDPRRRFLDNRSLLDLFPQELPGIQMLRARLPLMVEGPWGILHPVFFPFFFRCLYPYRFTTIPRRAKISTVYCFRFPRRAFSFETYAPNANRILNTYTRFDFQNDGGYKRKQIQS